MPDADESFRQNMHQEAANELLGRKAHLFLATAIGIILVAKSNAPLLH